MVTKRKASKEIKAKDAMPNGSAPVTAPPNGAVPNGTAPTEAISNGRVPTEAMPNGATPNDAISSKATPTGAASPAGYPADYPPNSGPVTQNSVPTKRQAPTNSAAYTRAATSRRVADQRKKHRFRRWRKRIIIGIIVLIVVVIVGIFSWDRWFRYNDEADLEGTWVVHNTQTAVVIDGQTISFAGDIAYSYEIDPESKTITYTFGTMEGGGRYRFSADRNQVAIVDGDSYSWWSTLWDDIGWAFSQAIEYIQGSQSGVSEMAEDENATVLDRTS